MTAATFHAGDRFSYQRTAAFADTDMSGRVHFAMILRYVEEAEHAFLSSIGEKVISTTHGWPRVHVDCDYRAPVYFGDLLTVELHVTAIGTTSVKYSFALRKEQQLCAEGSMVIVRVEGSHINKS